MILIAKADLIVAAHDFAEKGEICTGEYKENVYLITSTKTKQMAKVNTSDIKRFFVIFKQ